jgi:dTDP-glucose 4,6-dehydratase
VRVVLSGGAGFVGSHVAEALVERGDEVVVIDNLLTGRADNLRTIWGDCTVLEHDVAAARVEGPVDAVLHLASPASPPDYSAYPLETLDAGTAGTHAMLRLASENNARFLLASTSEIYGDPLEHPQREDYWGNVNPIGPRSVYDEAKRCAEAYTMAYQRAGLRTHIARIFNTYGPRMRSDDGRAIPNFFTQALSGQKLTVYGDGTQTRSLCYIDDLVDGLLLLVESDEFRPVNLGSPGEITMLELARRVAALSGIDINRIEYLPLPVDDPQRRCPDISRARQVLGWTPPTPLDAGLRKTLDWWRAVGPLGDPVRHAEAS